jgi:hypothetical protein
MLKINSHSVLGVSKTLWSIGDIVAPADNPKYMRKDED